MAAASQSNYKIQLTLITHVCLAIAILNCKERRRVCPSAWQRANTYANCVKCSVEPNSEPNPVGYKKKKTEENRRKQKNQLVTLLSIDRGIHSSNTKRCRRLISRVALNDSGTYGRAETSCFCRVCFFFLCFLSSYSRLQRWIIFDVS